MAWDQIIKFINDLLLDESKHFLLAFTLGSLAFALTSIMSYVCISIWEHLTHRTISTVAVYITVILCLLLGLSVALLSHYGLDYSALLYVTPLGPSLEIVK